MAKKVLWHDNKKLRKCFETIIETKSKIEQVNVFGSPKSRTGVISFNVDGIHAQDLAQFLNEDNIAIRVGHHCAQPLLSRLNENSVARLSLYIYNDETDIDLFCNSLASIKQYF